MTNDNYEKSNTTPLATDFVLADPSYIPQEQTRGWERGKRKRWEERKQEELIPPQGLVVDYLSKKCHSIACAIWAFAIPLVATLTHEFFGNGWTFFFLIVSLILQLCCLVAALNGGLATIITIATAVTALWFHYVSYVVMGIAIAISIEKYECAVKKRTRVIMEEQAKQEEEEKKRQQTVARRDALNLLVPKTSENDKVYLTGGEKRRDFQAINGVKDDLEVVYYRSGQINKRQYYKNGALTGEATTYYPDGQVYIVAHYLNNFLNGQYTIYNHDGSILETREFQNGERVA